ncbi:hypothetical protein [Parapedobacter indicus]|uniref:Uncharacterized protein n=1 Tax=Parapedobacter indicus TaxID=1477437 RepID=A0A1I3V2H8_9SPHI|nr:hypothetical protein [Parapedobacter indicus]PPK99024.1 hypothetical protein CLV26_11554 [Parapedobacter indicus]SFJ88341.1 hypothetical protein SAMN05444682_115123 [Parapedobacter indicus]
MKNHKPLLISNGFGYTDFRITCDRRFAVITGNGYPVINNHDDGAILAPWDWELIQEVSSDGQWVPFGEPSKDSYPQFRSYIKVSDKPCQTYFDQESGDIFAIRRGADVVIFGLITVLCVALVAGLVWMTRIGGVS